VQENAIFYEEQVVQPVGMLNLLALVERLARLPKFLEEPSGWEMEWDRDPLSHPDLQRMTLEQLADLPFDRGTPPGSQKSSGYVPIPSQESGWLRLRRH